MNPLPLILGRWRRQWAGSLFFVAILACTLALGLMMGVVERGVRQGANRAADPFALVVGAAGGTTQLVLSTVYLQPAPLPLLPGAALRALQADPRAAWAAPIGFGDSWRGLPVVGTTAPFVTLGGRRALAEGRVFAGDGEAVVGSAVPLQLGETLTPNHGHALPLHAHAHDGEDDDDDKHEGVVYRVVGRLPPSGGPWDQAILVPITAVWSVHGLADGRDGGETAGVPAVVVQPKSVADAYALRGQWRAGGTTAVFPAEVLLDLYRLLGGAERLGQILAGAAAALVGIVVVAALLLVVAAQARWIATLRAVGAGRGFIFVTIWLELAVVLTAAGAGALVLGLAGARLIAGLIADHTGFLPPIAVTADDVARLALYLVAGAVLAGLPAWVAIRRPIGPALKSGG